LIAELEAAILDDAALDSIAALIHASTADNNLSDESWTVRDEANALTALAFRNGFLEDLHAGKHSELLSDPNLSRITNKEMRKLMIESSAQLARMLRLREADPETYARTIRWFRDAYCARWERVATTVDIEREN
jgi:DNA-binding GntR family transcriptional regulator